MEKKRVKKYQKKKKKIRKNKPPLIVRSIPDTTHATTFPPHSKPVHPTLRVLWVLYVKNIINFLSKTQTIQLRQWVLEHPLDIM